MRKNIPSPLICFTSFCKRIVLFLIIALPLYAQCQDVVPDAVEYAALKDLYQNTNNGSGWSNTTNWPTTWPATATSAEFGTWFGVGVSNGDVTSLHLGFNNLTGTIPASLGNLTQLYFVGLNSNNLSDGFPAAALSNAHNLQYIYLDHNQLSGPLPAWSGTDFQFMQYLNLSFNQFTGTVPTSYTTFAYLDLLDLAYNQLTGFPSAFASMTWLRDLRLSGNPFPSGPMPSWIGQMSGLTTLLMEGNNFTGTIPASLGDLHNLEYLSLNANQFTGSIPAALAGCTSMTALDLMSNQLDDMSNDLSALTHLGYLGLSNNRFHGPIPEWFGHLPAMYQLYMNGNQFTSLPSSFSNLTSLTYVYLQDNQLTGRLPDVSGMTNLNTVNVARNKFRGSVPSSFSGRNIYFFDASDNQLSGEFPAISNWTRLVSLTITRNQFSGAFPSTAGLNALTFVEATANRFTSFPTTLLNLPSISYISFQGNQLTTIDNFETEVAANLVHPPGNLGILFIDQNQLDFKTIGTLGSLGFPIFAFPQNAISDVKNVAFNLNGSLTIPSRALQPTTTITWEKKEGGTWSDVTANTEDATHKTFLRSSAVLSDAGTYRWKATDSQFPDGVINSTEIEVNEALQIAFDNYAYQYKYDGRKRMTHKKVPGADWVYMVYDKRDRLVMTQDGNQRGNNQWSYTQYDALNRPIVSGIYSHPYPVSQQDMTTYVENCGFYEEFNGNSTYHGYTNSIWNTQYFYPDQFDALAVTYYDDYSFRSMWDGDFQYQTDNLSQLVAGQNVTYTQPSEENRQVIGQVTGIKVKVLDAEKNIWMRSATYYDDKYRAIQTISDNTRGGKDRTSNLVDFIGKVLKSKTTHTDNSALLQWQNVSGVTINANTVTRQEHDGWAWAGASSVEMLPAYTDGWVEVTAISQANSQSMIGLSSSSSGGNPFSIDYALFLNGNSLLFYENGSQIPDIGSPFNPGDLLRVVRAGTTIRYYINSNLIYTSSIPSSDALLVDVSLANAGAVLQNVRTSFKTKTNTTARIFTYDHAGRLLTTHHSINGATPVLLAENKYNELGQLVDKNLHSTDGTTFKQSVDYRYNIRGWLTSINNADLTPGTTNEDASGFGKDLFGMELAYEKPVSGLNTTDDVQYNSNISAITYSNNQALGAIKSNGYKYKYDPMNRLTDAEFRQKNITWGLSAYVDAGNVTQTAQAFSETGFKYDLNGNISELKRSGAAGSQQMDDLTYKYDGNQLLSVNERNGGDVSKGFLDGNVTGDDYDYDVNGNMTADENKDIADITYNHLNLPEKVTKGTGDYIKYIYDATGRKLSQQVYDPANVLKKKTDYAGEYFYENDTLKFINHEEGRVVLVKEGQPIAPEYQYHLKDHLGNVRTTFTTKDTQETYTATLEDNTQSTEQNQFNQYSRVTNDLYDHTDPGTTYNKAQLLNGGYNSQVGLTKSLSVMPGDIITAEVYAKYFGTTGASGNMAAFASALLSAFGLPNPAVGEVGTASSAINNYGAFIAAGNNPGNNGWPKGWLSVLVFDKNYNLIDLAFQQLDGAYVQSGATKAPHQFLSKQVAITEPGYVYIYVSNEGNVQQDIYFDDFQVTQTQSPVIASEEYYPFGLTFNEYQRENSLLNNYQYNGKEKQDELGLNMLDYGARMYMSDIGRWGVIDPLSTKYYQFSSYSYVANRPTIARDPDGRKIYYINDTGELRQATKNMVRTLSGLQIYSKYSRSKSDDVYIGVANFGKNRTAGAFTVANSNDGSGRYGVAVQNSKLHVTSQIKEVQNAYSVFQDVDFSKSKGRNIHLVSVSNESLKEHDANTGAEIIYHELKAHVEINSGDADEDHAKYGKDNVGIYLEQPILDPFGNTVQDENGRTIVQPTRQSPAGQFIQQLLINSAADAIKNSLIKNDLYKPTN